jgi:hypothetical protein
VVNNIKKQVCILNVPCIDISEVDVYVHKNCSLTEVHNKLTGSFFVYADILLCAFVICKSKLSLYQSVEACRVVRC